MTDEHILTQEEIDAHQTRRNQWANGLERGYYNAFVSDLPSMSHIALPHVYERTMYFPTTDAAFLDAGITAWSEFVVKLRATYTIQDVAMIDPSHLHAIPLVHEKQYRFSFRIAGVKVVDESQRITKAILIDQLKGLSNDQDLLVAQADAARLMIRYIDDKEIEAAYDEIGY
jgi:hypothetical protein